MGILNRADDARVRRLTCRGLLVLAALVLPTSMLLMSQPDGAAQELSQDSLWAGDYEVISACASPSSPESLATCFAQTMPGPSSSEIQAMATDGINVYYATISGGGLSCPIDQLGQNCTAIMTGPWPSSDSVNALAAADGQVWIGQDNGRIYRCPANIPYQNQSSAPETCVLLDDAGNRPVSSLLLANGRLYAGLKHSPFGDPGLIWSCDPEAANQCVVLDEYGSTTASALVAGSGYLWAGLHNGVLWRCDLNAAGCDDWDTAANQIFSISYDGQDTIYAAVPGSNGVVWSCPIDAANSCSNLRYPVNPTSVVAGAGGVFSSTHDDIAFNTSIFTNASMAAFRNSLLLYIPAEGMSGVGGIDLSVRLEEWTQRIGRHCDASGEGKKVARVTITGPNSVKRSLSTDLCALRPGGTLDHSFDLLDPGKHKIKVRARGFIGKAKVVVEGNATTPVKLRLRAHR